MAPKKSMKRGDDSFIEGKQGLSTEVASDMVKLDERDVRYDYCYTYIHEEADAKESDSEKEARLAILKKRAALEHRLKGVDLQLKKSIAKKDKDSKGSKLVYVRITCSMQELMDLADKIDFDVKLKATAGGGYGDFSKDLLHVYETPNGSVFTTAQRMELILYKIEQKRRLGGAAIDVLKMKKEGVITDFYPLHDHDRLEELNDHWLKKPFKSLTLADRSPGAKFAKPIENFRQYFGTKIALYLAWLEFYTLMLILPALFGIVLFAINADETSYDNWGSIAYSIFMAFWATFFLELWKRKQATYAYEWGTTNFEAEETARPEFNASGDTVERKNYKGQTEYYFPPKKSLCRRIFGLPVIFSMLVAVVISILAIFSFRLWANEEIDAPQGGIAAGAANGVTIGLLNFLWGMIATKLTDWETHRTDTEYDDSRTAKVFIFQFINSYFALFYIAFVKMSGPTLLSGDADNTCNMPANGDEDDGDCMEQLSITLGSLFVTKLVVANAVEYIVPLLKKCLKGKGSSDAPQYEQEAARGVYGGVFDDYSEMIIQYGYVVLFAAAFPLASVAAFINNVVEIRGDAHKLIHSLRRPEIKHAADLGTWFHILELISTLAVINNVMLVCFTSTVLATDEGKSEVDRWKIAMGAEHAILGLKWIIATIIPDTPKHIQEASAKREYLRAVTYGEIAPGSDSDFSEVSDAEDDLEAGSDDSE